MIEVDYRERDSATAAELRKAGAELTFVALKAGDYRIDRVLAIERKSAWDYRQSLFDGRLFRQLTKLVRSAPRPLLLLEGLQPAVAEPAMRGSLVTVTALFGVPVLFSQGPAESAELILSASRQYEARREEAYARPGWRPKGKRARQIFVLQGLPGVGAVRAGRLLDRFGTVRAVFNADEAMLQEVEGIGPAIARRMVELAT